MSDFSPISDLTKQLVLAQLCEQLDDAVFILDDRLCYLSINRAYEVMIGYSEEFVLGRPLGIYAAEFLSVEERHILQDISSCLNNQGFYEKSFSMPNRYGQQLDCHMTYHRISINDHTYYVGIVSDISSAVQDRQKVTHLLNFDQVSGLPNRKVFLSQLSELLIDGSNNIVIVRFNIDKFRALTSSLGASWVNLLIGQFVQRVNAQPLEYLKCFSHFGGDDFAMVFECSDAHMIPAQIDRLTQICEQPFILNSTLEAALSNDNQAATQAINPIATLAVTDTDSTLDESHIYLHFSIGVSCYPKDDSQLMGLLSKAEKALYYVKEQGGADTCWYYDDLNQLSSDSLLLEAELRQAIDEQQFVPYYQPKVALATGQITGFEALVRWQHPSRGLLKPASFIDAIVKHKLSFELFCQLASKIAKHLSEWRALGFDHYVSINADAAEFNHPEFFDFVNTLFSKFATEPSQWHVEVTESSLMLRHSKVKQQLSALKKLGICLALDDFGTGYASLSYLQQYPFDYIKIDKSFMYNIAEDKTQQAIVKAILDLATALNMGAIAEGIETQQQRDLLTQMGCRYAQGYWFSRPVDVATATKMLTDKLSFD